MLYIISPPPHFISDSGQTTVNDCAGVNQLSANSVSSHAFTRQTSRFVFSEFVGCMQDQEVSHIGNPKFLRSKFYGATLNPLERGIVTFR